MRTKHLAFLIAVLPMAAVAPAQKMQARIDALKSLVAAQESTIQSLTQKLSAIRSNHQQQLTFAAAQVQRSNANQAGVQSLVTQDNVMKSRLQNILINVNTIQVTGANLQITNSDFATANPNGLGNLFIGHNLWSGSGTPQRSGSHNLVIGNDNQYTSWNSLLIGEHLKSYGRYQYLGGYYNEALSDYAAILTGSSNRVSANAGVILAAMSSRVSAQRGVVGAGTQNQIVGGLQNVIVTGVQNMTNGTQTTIATAFNANMKQTTRSATGGTKFLDTWSHYTWFTP